MLAAIAAAAAEIGGRDLLPAGSCARESEEAPTALMQLKTKVQRGDQPSETLLPMGRTFLSTDPDASAEFLVKFYNAGLVALPACTGTARAAVRMPDTAAVIVFVKDDSLPIGDVDLRGLIRFMNKTLVRAVSGIENTYYFHLDSHDGWHVGSLVGGIEYLSASSPVVGYSHSSHSGQVDALVQIPQTMQTIQMHIADPVNIPLVVQSDCRTDDKGGQRTGGSWWKSTFSAANPEAAADVAVNVLRASRIDCPYPPVAGPNCTAGTWVQFPGTEFQLHFVKSQGYQAYPGEMQAFTRQVRSLRNLTAGRLDRFMYNSLMFRVSLLEPFVQRAQALGLPFLVVSTGPEEQALFLDVPENDITIQLRSKRVGVTSQTLPEWCAQNLGDLSAF